MFDLVGIIPARYASSRFPGKPLADLLGKPLIWHVYNAAKKYDKLKRIIVATDDNRIMDACRDLNMECMMTGNYHKDCLDRAYEVMMNLKMRDGLLYNRYIIIQGDEPMFNASVLDQDLSPEVVNFYTRINIEEEIDDPNVVKAVVSKDLKAIYFSRYAIPYSAKRTRKQNYDVTFDKQLGLYSFSFETLKYYNMLGMSHLESVEGIGLLRLLENGVPIHMRYSDYDSISVDTPEDLEYVKTII